VTPEDIIEAGLDFVGATDHNTFSGHDKLKKVVSKGIEVIKGIELTAKYESKKFHVLIIDPVKYPGIDSILVELHNQSVEKYRCKIDAIESIGFNTRGCKMKPDKVPNNLEIAHMIYNNPENKGIIRKYDIRGVRDLKKKVLKKNSSGKGLKGVDISDIVENLEGIYILAHPGENFFLPRENYLINNMLKEFTFQGIETESRKHTAKNEYFSKEIAKENKLVAVSSNDVHLAKQLMTNMTTNEQLEELRARR